MFFFSYYLIGDKMLLFLKGFIIGIGKIIPGVSGAMLAINFNIYERALDAITNFSSNWKENLKFLLIFISGVLLAIVVCSGIVLYLIENYFFLTMMFFIGLILGGTYNFSHEIKYNYKNIIIIILIVILLSIISFGNFSNNYQLQGNFIDNIVFFIGGIIEIFSSIVPGISGTAIFMLMGIYNNILTMMSSIFNIPYVIDNINIYISYGFGMFISFIINSYLISYLIKRYKNTTYSVILGLCISSIILLLFLTFKYSFSILEFILGIMLLVVGILSSCILDK